jgi:hypothetical protein
MQTVDSLMFLKGPEPMVSDSDLFKRNSSLTLNILRNQNHWLLKKSNKCITLVDSFVP